MKVNKGKDFLKAKLENVATLEAFSEKMKYESHQRGDILLIKDYNFELRKYEEKIHQLVDRMISIDLDNSDKANSAKFGDILSKIQ